MARDDVDKRVVEFEFDNSKFDKNVKKSKKTLEEFEETLEFKDVSKSLEQVRLKFSAFEVAAASAIKNITDRVVNTGIRLTKTLSIDNISAGWEKFGQKTIAVGTLMSQALKVAGKEIENYSDKMYIVNEQLDKLNWFTDQTSYNFTDMVDNIGKFTAAGQDLDKSVEAMMGIANWAALSGQNAVTASRAMYQLSQALGKGYVQLMDYKSIQNANMDTQEFRQTVLDTAVAMGELTKEGENYISKTGKKFTKNQFTEQLASKWFTSDVLTKSLEKYSAAVDKLYEISTETGLTASEVIEQYGDQFDDFAIKAFKAAQEARTFVDVINATKDAVGTGWMKTAEYIFGGYDEAKVFWTDLADALWEVFAAGGEVRNQILKVWTSLKGRADLFAHDPDNPEKQGAFWNIYDSIIALVDIVKGAWNTIFPKSAFEDEADQVNDLAHNFKIFTENLKKSTARIKAYFKENQTLKKILQGVFSIVRLVVGAFEALRYALEPLIYTVKSISDTLLDFFANLGDRIASNTQYVDTFYNMANRINEVLTNMLDFVDLPSLLDKITSALSTIGNTITKVFKTISNFFKEHVHLTDFIKQVGNALKTLGQNIRSLFNSFKKGVQSTKKISIFDAISGKQNKKSDDDKEAAQNLINKVKEENELFEVLKGFVEALGNLLKSIYPLLLSVIRISTSIINDATTLISSITKNLNGLAEKNKDIVETLKKLLIIAGVVFLAYEIGNIFVNMHWMLTYMKVNVYAFLDTAATALNKWGISKIIESIGASLKNIAISFLLLYAGFRLFKDMNLTWDDLWPGLVVLGMMAAFMIVLAATAKKLQSTTTLAGKTFTSLRSMTTLREIPAVLITFGASFLMIAKGVAMIAEIDSTIFWQAISPIIALGAILTLFGIFSDTSMKESKNLKQSIPSTLQFLSFALVLKVAITGVAGIVDALTGSDKKWWELAIILTAVTGAMALIITLLKHTTRIKGVGQGGYVFQFGSQVGGVLLGIAAVMYTINLLSNTIVTLGAQVVNVLKWVGIALGAVFLAAIALYVTVAIYSIKLQQNAVVMETVAKPNPIVNTLLSIAVMLAAVSGSIWILSQVKWSMEMIWFLIGLGGFIILLTGAVIWLTSIMKSKEVIEDFGEGKGSKTTRSILTTTNSISQILKGVAAVVLALSASVAILSAVSYAFGPEVVTKMTIMVGAFILAVMAMVLFIVKAMRKLNTTIKEEKKAKSLIKTILAIISVILVLGAFVAAIIYLDKYGAINVGIIIGMLLGALYGVVGVLAIINKMDIKFGAILKFTTGMALLSIGLITLVPAIIAIGQAIKSLQTNIVVDENAWKLLGYVTAFFAIFTGLGALIGYLPKIAGGMALVSAVIIISLALLGAAMQVLAWGLERLAPAMNMLEQDKVNALSNLLLNLSLTGLTGVLGALTTIAGNGELGVGMEILGWGLKNLVNPMNEMTSEGVSNLRNLLLWLSLTGVTGILAAITTVAGNGELGVGMETLGWGLKTLVGPMNEITSEGASNLGALLLILSGTGVTGILAVFGNGSIGAGMVALGTGLSALTPQLIELKPEHVRGLKELLYVLSGSGQGEGFIKSVANFVGELFNSAGKSSLATAMKELSKGLAELNPQLSNISVDSVAGLKALINFIKDSGNFKIENANKIASNIKGGLLTVIDAFTASIKNMMDTLNTYNNAGTLQLLDYIMRILDLAKNNNEFVIRPILDLSSIQSGYAEISSLMSSINGTSLSVTGRLAQKATEQINSGNNSANAGNISNVTNETYNVTFNVTSDDPAAIADAVDAELQKRHNNWKSSRGGGVSYA